MIELTTESIAAESRIADRLAWLSDSPENNFAGWSPGWQDDHYTPTAEDESEYLGYLLIMNGERPIVPAGLSESCVQAFREGVNAACQTLVMQQLEQEQAFAERYAQPDPWDMVSPNELIEARGYPQNPWDN